MTNWTDEIKDWSDVKKIAEMGLLIKEQKRIYEPADEKINQLQAENERLQKEIESLQVAAGITRERNKAANHEIKRLREALAEVREVWAGSDAFIPVTTPEAYSQRLCKQMYEIAIKALKENDDDI